MHIENVLPVCGNKRADVLELGSTVVVAVAEI